MTKNFRTDVIDVLQDGTITKLKIISEGVAIVEIERENRDCDFCVTKVEILTDNEENIQKSIQELSEYLLQMSVSKIEIPIVKSNDQGV